MMNLSGPSMNLGSSAPPSRGPKKSTKPGQKKSLWDRFGLALVSAIIVAVLSSFGITSFANASPAPTSSISPDGKALSTTQSYPEQCASNDNGKTCVKGSSVTTSKQTGSSFDEVKAGGSVVLEYLYSGGLTAKQIAGKKCQWMSGGWNTGRGYRNGKLMTGTWKDSTRQYVCHTGKGPSGYQVKKCGNTYYPKGTPGKEYVKVTKVLLVQKLAGRTLTGKVSAQTTSKANGSSTSDASSKYCTAHGSGSYTASATASSEASFSIKITSKMDVKAKLTAAFVKLALKQQTTATAKAWAKASSEAQGEARSDASCKDVEVTPPPVTVTPPVQPVPTITVTATTTVTTPATPGPTVTVTAPVPGPTITVTAPATPGPTTTVTIPASPAPTVTVPGPKETITVPGPTTTVTIPVPGPTVTVTVPATTPPTTPPATTPPTETPKPEKPIVNVERMNDQQIKTSTKGIKVNYVVSGSDSADISIKSNYGSITDVSKSTVSGSGVVTFTYTAPTEGTPDNMDTITVSIRVGATGTTASDSTQFKILVPGTNAPEPPL